MPPACGDAIDDAFPRSTIDIEVQSGHFELVMRQHGLLRPLRTAGTLRWHRAVSALAAALLTPRPPELLVLNEPETSLHEELLAPLAGADLRCGQKMPDRHRLAFRGVDRRASAGLRGECADPGTGEGGQVRQSWSVRSRSTSRPGNGHHR